MTRESQSGGDAAMPESDRATPVPRDVPDLAPGRGAAAAVQEALHLPVFDFITMINYVYSALAKSRYEGSMY